MTFPCDECESIFKEKRNLMQHMKTRHGLKKFKCNFCDIVETHIAEFLKLKGEQASPGFWSKQSMEAGHHDLKIEWEICWETYLINEERSPNEN